MLKYFYINICLSEECYCDGHTIGSSLMHLEWNIICFDLGILTA